MLLGTYKPNLIGENRLALPKKLRQEITGNQLVLYVGFEGCIFGFGVKKWEEATVVDLSRPLSDSAGRGLRRQLCMNAETANLDSQGRFVIPKKMMKYAGIKTELILIGAGDHFEIWSKESWGKYSHETFSSTGSLKRNH